MTNTHDTEHASTERAARDGGVNPDLLAQLEATLWLPHDMDSGTHSQRMAAARAMLQEIGPGPCIEDMLACQMVAAHEAAMACLGRSMAPEASARTNRPEP